jgi:succinylglutamate desuccinylase
MAALTNLRTTRLTILDALPDGFLNCRARDLQMMLDGPTLIELPGKREPPLFVSILLHGNEDSGLGAVQRVLSSYRDHPLPRSLMLLIGNVDAAGEGLRRLDWQPDYNRIWPGALNDAESDEGRVMAHVHARAVGRGSFAAIDLHNNTGLNPHYAVVCDLDPHVLGLAALFARRAVRFRGVAGTQIASFTGLIPAVTAECGLPGHPRNDEAAARFMANVLKLDELPDGTCGATPLELYHTLGVVRLKADVSVAFGSAEADLRLDPAIDQRNFRQLPAGTILGITDHAMPVSMIDENGRDVSAQYFQVDEGKLKLRKEAVPAMLTTDPRIVRQDCLCYLMERL